MKYAVIFEQAQSNWAAYVPDFGDNASRVETAWQ